MKSLKQHTLKIAYLLSVIVLSAIFTLHGLISGPNETGAPNTAVESLPEPQLSGA